MENEMVVLAASCGDGTIKIRIDRNGLAISGFGPNPVTVLDLESCTYDAEVQDALLDSVNKSIFYEVMQVEDRFQVSFWIDYHDDENRVACAHFRSNTSEYAFEELMWKCERLAGAYLVERRTGEINAFLYRSLLEKIQKEARKEMNSCQQKIDFFRNREPESANRYGEIMKINQKLLTLTGIVDQQDLRVLIRKKFSVMWDDDGFEYQIERNQQIREEIVQMGEAALFPLLEMLISLDPSWRSEILNLIEKINPELLYHIQMSLVLD